MKLTAIFESEDTAQFALGRLREANIGVQSVRMRHNDAAENRTGETDIGFLPAFYMGAGADMASLASGPYSTGLFPGKAAPSAAVRDVYSEEVLLEIAVPPEDARMTESLLINARGRQIRGA